MLSEWYDWILAAGAVSGAVITIITAIQKFLIKPINSIAEKYTSQVEQFNKQIEQSQHQIDAMNTMYNNGRARFETVEKTVEEIKTNFNTLERSMQTLLRATLFAEITRLLSIGYRTNADTKRLFSLHEAYTKMGLNGLGNEYFKLFLALPLKNMHHDELIAPDEEPEIEQVE